MRDPIIDEEFDPDRTILSLSLEKKQAINASDNDQKTKQKSKKL